MGGALTRGACRWRRRHYEADCLMIVVARVSEFRWIPRTRSQLGEEALPLSMLRNDGVFRLGMGGCNGVVTHWSETSYVFDTSPPSSIST